jgi:electron transfer flavoprotein beta subunit
MNIFVCIKQVPDTETKIKLKPDNSWIDTAGIKWMISPYDAMAVEEAIRIKEKNAGSTVTLISAGPARLSEMFVNAIAMGADEAIRVDVPETADSNLAAKALAGALKKQPKVDLILCGKEAIDDGAAQVSQLVAASMGLPCITVALAIEFSGAGVKCKREVEGGAYEMIESPLPAVVAVQKGINEPRYAKLPDLMKAKKKEIKVVSMADAGVSESDQKIRYKNFQLPPPKQAGKKVAGEPAAQAKELARLLHEEAKVI